MNIEHNKIILFVQTTESVTNQRSLRVKRTRHGTGHSVYRKNGFVMAIRIVLTGQTRTQRR